MLKPGKLAVSVYDAHGAELLKQPLVAMTIPEALILQKSVEWYDDPAPCIIHRSAVQSRLYLEFVEYCEKETLPCRRAFAELPEHFKTLFELPEGGAYLEVTAR